MIVRGVVVEAPNESLKKVPPTANQLDVLATLRIRKHVEAEAFKFANLAILETEGFSTAYEASILIGWWTNADIGAKTKLLLEVAEAMKEAGCGSGVSNLTGSLSVTDSPSQESICDAGPGRGGDESGGLG